MWLSFSDGRLAPLSSRIVPPGHIDELDTPCLVVDLDAFERNVRTCFERLAGLDVRPHQKTAKSRPVARRRLAELRRRHPYARVRVVVDSVAGARAVDAALATPIEVLVDGAMERLAVAVGAMREGGHVPYRSALSALATVISHASPERAVVDAGLKTVAGRSRRPARRPRGKVQ
jgi:D-serine deaminase-like pyridoxal phosphate-dependent protein